MRWHLSHLSVSTVIGGANSLLFFVFTFADIWKLISLPHEHFMGYRNTLSIIKLLERYNNIEDLPNSMVEFDEYLEWLEEFGRQNYMFNIPRETAEYLKAEIIRNKSRNILEIGMSNGYSTIWLASAAEKNKGMVTTIEIDKNKISLAENNFKKSKLRNIKIKHGNALDVIPKLRQKFDFVFIDATKKEYLDYFLSIEKKLAKNAIIVADNIISHNEKVRSFLAYFDNNKRYRAEIIDIGTGLLKITKKKRK